MAKYSNPVKQINAAFFNAYGRNATRKEILHWQRKPMEELATQLRNPKAGAKLGSIYNPNPVAPVNPENPVTTPVVNPEPTPTTTAPSYEDWLKGAGSPYANQYSREYLNQEFDPYYQRQLGGEDYLRDMAKENLNRGIQDTQNVYGRNYNERGLYGSGIYQQELGKQLGELNRGYEQNYGSGEYTPYSLRKQQILENQKIAKAQAGIQRQGQAWNVYAQQFYPQLINQ